MRQGLYTHTHSYEHDTLDSTFAYILIAQSQNSCVVARVANKATFEERDVKDGRIEVYELEDEHFEGEIVIKLSLGAMHLCDMTTG